MAKRPKYHQGFFTPLFPNKYKGDTSKIIFRSGLEKNYMVYFDTHSKILEWNSEEVIIPYDWVDGKCHRYFVDFWIKVQNNNGEIKEYLVEIKPHSQTLPPKTPKRQTQKYKMAVATFFKNQAKWEAAKKSALKNGMEFIILTEKNI